MLNAQYTNASFYSLPKSHQAGFAPGSWRVVTVPAGTKLFKLSQFDITSKWGTTPWWSPVDPFLDDKFGIRATYEKASADGQTLAQVIRHLSSVCIDWNELTKFQQIRLRVDAKAFWGTFNPMPKFSNAPWLVGSDNPNSIETLKKVKKMNEIERKDGLRNKSEVKGAKSWQLHIANMKPEHFEVLPEIPSHETATIGIALGFVK